LITEYGTNRFYPHEFTDLFKVVGNNLHANLHDNKLIDVVGKHEEGNFDKDGKPNKTYHHDHVDGTAFKKWIEDGKAHFVQIPYGLNIPIVEINKSVKQLNIQSPTHRLLLSANPESRRLDGDHKEHNHIKINSKDVKVSAVLIEEGNGKFKLYNINNEILKSTGTYKDRKVIAYVPHEETDHGGKTCPNHSHSSTTTLQSLDFQALLERLFEKIIKLF